jgi:serine/threonine protein kinase
MRNGDLVGPYRILGKPGEGGMGEVYKARDTRLDRTVAIKVLPAELSADPGRRARIGREAKAVAALNDAHICTLHDVGEHEGSTFLVMELLQGETLAARLGKGPLPLAQALAVAIDIADGLAAAHRGGLIHRDLKPGNVMLTAPGPARQGSPQAKLLDFGLAKVAGAPGDPFGSRFDSELPQGGKAPGLHEDTASTHAAPLTRQGAIVGTLQYMAPEQLEAQPAAGRRFRAGAIVGAQGDTAMVIKRFEPLSVGKVAGILYAAMGLIVGVIVSLAATMSGLAGRGALGVLTGGLVGIGAILVLPIFYGVLGFIVAVIAAWLYNLAAGFVGGIEIDVQ